MIVPPRVRRHQCRTRTGPPGDGHPYGVVQDLLQPSNGLVVADLLVVELSAQAQAQVLGCPALLRETDPLPAKRRPPQLSSAQLAVGSHCSLIDDKVNCECCRWSRREADCVLDCRATSPPSCEAGDNMATGPGNSGLLQGDTVCHGIRPGPSTGRAAKVKAKDTR